MRKLLFCLSLLTFPGCGDKASENPNAQEIVNRAIEVSGGEGYLKSSISFDFRNAHYEMEHGEFSRVLKRMIKTDTSLITDIKEGEIFQRLINDSLVEVPDSMATRYANSVNSVHYFAYLPYGLNDPAVNKKLPEKTSW